VSNTKQPSTPPRALAPSEASLSYKLVAMRRFCAAHRTGSKPTGVQALVAMSPMETRHASVLGRLTGPDAHRVGLPLDSTDQEVVAGQFGPAVTANHQRSAVRFDGFVQHACHKPDGELVSTSRATLCLVKLSSTRSPRALAVLSLAKSFDYSWSGAVSRGGGRNTRASRLRRFLFIIRPSSRYARCTFLRFTAICSRPSNTCRHP